MTPPGFVLPDLPADTHRAAAETMLRLLTDSFPDAGVGVTGSVATGMHRPESDLDLLVVDASFRREMQFATVAEGIRTAVLCLRPGFDEERERRWMLAAGGDVRMLSMVRTAFVARDPAGVLGAMQRTLARLDDARRAHADALLAVRREHALAAVRALRDGDGAGGGHLRMELLSAVVDGWFLRRGLALHTKQAVERKLETIARDDAVLAAHLRRALPVRSASMAPLLRAMDHVFAPAPPGEARSQSA